MIVKLETTEYSNLKEHKNLYSFPLIAVVLENKQAGNIYANDNVAPTLAFIIHKSGFSYLFIKEVSSINFMEFIEFLVESEDIPEYFHIYEPPLSLIGALTHFKEISFKIRKRIQLRFGSTKVIAPSIKNTNIQLITQKISSDNFSLLDNFNLFIANKFWESKKLFLLSGFGVIIFSNNVPACVCYSACLVNSIAEIDIVTKPEFQNLGIGKFAVSQFINQGLEKNVLSNWDCFENNTSSYKLALSIGFQPIKSYDFLSIFVKRKITNESK